MLRLSLSGVWNLMPLFSALSQAQKHILPYRILGLFAISILLWLAACAAPPAATSEPILTATLSSTTVSQLITPTPTVSPTPSGPITLTVWWPDTLVPASQESASLQLADYIDSFHTTTSEGRIETRQKKVQDVGGIMETLKAASAVAPAALPDVTLLRRADLLTAIAAGYIQPIDGLITSAVLGDLYPTALELGRLNGIMYGLPYAINIEHIAYRPVLLSGNFALFDDVLADQQTFVFPAGVTDGLSNVLYLQYLSAGGTVSDLTSGKPNQTALRTVLTFYQEAVAQGIIDPSVLDYARSDDYLFQLREGKMNAAVITSTQYLGLLADGHALDAAPIPLARGEPTTVVNGWMWVIVTKDKARQAFASRFIEYMMGVERQATYTRLVNMLPSRRAAMRVWESGPYATLADQLLLNARLPIFETGDNITLRALQNALSAVIGGQRTPDEAVKDVIEQVSR
ncbi:MAG: extracellular solute-binding protein [Anaerolineae bacterium]